jgi:hypothetical protein
MSKLFFGNMANKNQEVEKLEVPTFTKITENVLGAEGPVFNKEGHFFMVAPEVEKDKKPAGQILKVDLEKCEVFFS